jgi:glycosyltransferase involved in cell wall biosynthesis
MLSGCHATLAEVPLLMRVLWLVRRNLRQHTGGDTTQILNTAAAVRARGIEVDLRSDMPTDLVKYEAAHLFHLDRLWENAAHARSLARAGLPFVLSTIYWPPAEYDRHGRAGFQGGLARVLGSGPYQNLRLIQRWVLRGLTEGRVLHPVSGFQRGAKDLLARAAVLLPNSRAEAEAIRQAFGVERPAVVVPNAVNAAQFEANSGTDREGVLCVGRIEPRKNQLNLIRAIRGTGIRLTLVGRSGRFSRGYDRRCRREADSNARFMDQRSPGQLAALYRSAHVHACVSWYETPGLVSLEAALCGCVIVVTPGGSTREYFGDDAVYCEAGKVESIREAILDALARAPSRELEQRIRTRHTWEKAAARTIEGYEKAARA